MRFLLEYFTTLLSKLTFNDFIALSTFYIHREENFRGFTYSEIVEMIKLIDKNDLLNTLPTEIKYTFLEKEEITPSNVYRILQKLVDQNLVEKSIGGKQNEVYYSINRRGMTYFELFQDSSKILTKAFDNLLFAEKKDKVYSETSSKVEFWTPNGKGQTFESFDSLKEHWINNVHRTYSKNFYRFYKKDGRHLDIVLSRINSEEQLSTLFFGYSSKNTTTAN